MATGTALTEQEIWRLQHFDTTSNTGNAVDSWDSNNDGEANLLEFATGQNPLANSRATPVLVPNGTTLEFTYTRANAALAAGMAFTVEWSDTLASGSWTNAGVIQQVLTDNGTTQSVKASIAAGSHRRFLRLKVSTP